MKIIDIKATDSGKIDLPRQFSEDIRPDLIKRAFLAIQSHNKQAYGANKDAGKRASAKLSRRRRNYRGAYGYGISRVPRKIMSRSGTRFSWVGAFAPGTVGGRKAHAPKAEKKIEQKINKKERRKAIRSAIAATLQKELVESRGHILPKGYPFIITDDIESIKKAKTAIEILKKIGLEKELERTEKKKVRAGKGKGRGRKYRKKKGVLIVVSKKCQLEKSAKNIPGIDIVEVKNLNVQDLAPGANPGRLTLWSKSSITKLQKEDLFY